MAESSPIHVNEANGAQLQNLRFIGPKRAERILAWRMDVGPVTDSITFARVAGISPAQAALIGDNVRLSAPTVSPRLAGALASAIALLALTTLLMAGGGLAFAAAAAALSAVFISALDEAGKLPAQHRSVGRASLRDATSPSLGMLACAWFSPLGAPALFTLLSAWIAATILGPAICFHLHQRQSLSSTFIQNAAYLYRETPVASLALGAGLIAGSPHTAIAVLFAVWSAAAAGINTRERMDPSGGFAAAHGETQHEDFERLQSTGLQLLPRDDISSLHARILRMAAAAVAAAGLTLGLGTIIL